MLSRFAALTLIYISALALTAQTPKLPNERGAKEFMRWFTNSDYWDRLHMGRCICAHAVPIYLGFPSQRDKCIQGQGTTENYIDSAGLAFLYRQQAHLESQVDSQNFPYNKLDSSGYDSLASWEENRIVICIRSQTKMSASRAIENCYWTRDYIDTSIRIHYDTAIIPGSSMPDKLCNKVLSYPLFSRDRKLVLIGVSSYCVGLCGYGEVLLFQKTGKEWKLVCSYYT